MGFFDSGTYLSEKRHMLTPQQFIAATGNKNLNILNGLNATMDKFNINSPLKIRHFMAQLMHESDNFTAVRENLNYSAVSLLAVFRSHFKDAAEAALYARQPEKIGNRVYSNRMGNGSEVSGEGYKFRGRGYIQITGKENYAALSKALGVDLINKPELLEIPMYAALSAGWYWNSRNLSAIANSSLTEAATIEAITRKINGGTNGLEHRVAIYTKLKAIIK